MVPSQKKLGRVTLKEEISHKMCWHFSRHFKYGFRYAALWNSLSMPHKKSSKYAREPQNTEVWPFWQSIRHFPFSFSPDCFLTHPLNVIFKDMHHPPPPPPSQHTHTRTRLFFFELLVLNTIKRLVMIYDIKRMWSQASTNASSSLIGISSR